MWLMPIASRNLHTKCELNTCKAKELLPYHCGCHGNLATIAMRYVADAYCPKEPPYQIWTEYDIRQSELLTYHCCCHGNLVTIAMRYVTDAYHPKEPPYQIWLNTTQDK